MGTIGEVASGIARATGSGPASPEAIEELRAVLPVWSEELAELLAHCDGSDYTDVLPPHDFLLSTGDVATHWRLECEIAQRLFGTDVLDRADALPAGSQNMWSRRLIPVTGDGAGDGWVVDLRDGPMRGQVFRWIRTDGLMPPPSEPGYTLSRLLATRFSSDPMP